MVVYVGCLGIQAWVDPRGSLVTAASTALRSCFKVRPRRRQPRWMEQEDIFPASDGGPVEHNPRRVDLATDRIVDTLKRAMSRVLRDAQIGFRLFGPSYDWAG